jgi:cephalosporin hydroxylase
MKQEYRANRLKFIRDVWNPQGIYLPSLTTDFEKEALFEAAQKAPEGDALVVGCYYGADLFIIAKTFELTGSEGNVCGLDPWNPDDLFRHDEIYKREGLDSPMQFVEKKAADYGLADRIWLIQDSSKGYKWNNPLSLLVIDGDHSKEMCMNDLECFAHHVVKGGYILVHDYKGDDVCWEGVPQAVDEWMKLHQECDFYTCGSFAIIHKPEV